MWPDSFICVTCGTWLKRPCLASPSPSLIHAFVCDMVHSYVTRLIRMWHGSFAIRDMTHTCVTWLIHVWHDSYMCGMTHTCVTWLIHGWHDSYMCDMTHTCVTWLIHVWERDEERIGGREDRRWRLHTSTYCNTLQRTATHYDERLDAEDYTLQQSATHCNATHCNTLQHSATLCNTLRWEDRRRWLHTHAHTQKKTMTHTCTHVWNEKMTERERERKREREREKRRTSGLKRKIVCVCVWCVCVWCVRHTHKRRWWHTNVHTHKR